MIVRFVDIGRIIDHHCLEMIVRLVDIGRIIDHHCLEMIVRFVDIGRIIDHHCFNFLFIMLCILDLLFVVGVMNICGTGGQLCVTEWEKRQNIKTKDPFLHKFLNNLFNDDREYLISRISTCEW